MGRVSDKVVGGAGKVGAYTISSEMQFFAIRGFGQITESAQLCVVDAQPQAVVVVCEPLVSFARARFAMLAMELHLRARFAVLPLQSLR